MQAKKYLPQQGFTIIELMIATSVFSVILLVCATGLIQISRMYQKGVISSKTQETARSVISNVSEAIQFSSGSYLPLADTNGVKGFCVDNKRYSYKLDTILAETGNHVLVVDTLNGCSSSTPSLTTAGGKELLSPKMRLRKLVVTDKGNNLYNVELELAYGDDDVFDGGGNCIVTRLGGSFCAISKLSTTVQKRIIK